jgi:hypothetical protein
MIYYLLLSCLAICSDLGKKEGSNAENSGMDVETSVDKHAKAPKGTTSPFVVCLC